MEVSEFPVIRAEFFTIPDMCPVCSGPLSEEGQFLYCRSRSCPVQLSGSVKVWIKRLGLLHWGDALVDALTNPENSKVSSLADLYRLSVDDIAACSSGNKFAQKCWDVLHSNKKITIELLLASLNIPNLAVATATDIVQAGYSTVDKLLSMSYEDLLKVPNVGEKTARQIYDGIQDRRDAITELSLVLEIIKPNTGPLSGIRICITGDLWAPRPAVHKMILTAGGIVKTSITKDLDFLVADDTQSGTSKLTKAAKLGIAIIGGEKLRQMLGC